jgi:glycosyltransferase involved in cell wall biosynthesis
VTDGLIHVSAYEAEIYRRKIHPPNCPAHVVLNGLQPDEFEPVTPEPDAADFLFIGELRDLKGVDVLIKALAMLRREGEAPRALIVGRGPPEDEARYRGMVTALNLSENVEFRPPMPARGAFALARTVVVPSRAESMPYLVLEAAAAAVPLIATHVGGIPEILGEDDNRLLPPGDVAALAAALRSARAEPEKLAREALQARIRVEQKFSLARMAERMENIYRRALEGRYSPIRASEAPEADLSR